MLTCGISRSPPHLAFPIPLGIPSLTRGPTRSPLFTSPSHPGPLPHPRSFLGSPPHSPSRSFPVPRSTDNSVPGMLVAAAPGPRAGTPAVTLAPVLSPQHCHPRPRRHRLLSLVPRVALCRVLACCVPTRSLRPRVRVALHSPRRTLATAAAAVRGAAPPGVANRTRLRGARPAPTRLRPRLRPLPRSDRPSIDLT